MKIYIDILNKIIRSVLEALYQPFWAALLLACISMFVYLYGKEHQWKIQNFIPRMIKTWWNGFKSSSTFRRTFLLVFYTTMILFRTILNREIWFDPLGKIMGGWGLYNVEGNLTTEAIENFMLFVPYAILLLWAFRRQVLGEKIYLKKILWVSFKMVGIFSLSIEFLQVLIHVGTFQLSDLCYNTLGGLLGGLIYYLMFRWKCRER